MVSRLHGLLRKVPRSDAPDRGLIFRMHETGVPVIHLLNIEHLAARQGLPIDPVPLPAPEDPDYPLNRRSQFWQTFFLSGILLLIGGVFTWRTQRSKGYSPAP